MKYLIFAVLLIGCNEIHDNEAERLERGIKYEIIKIDGCQYIYWHAIYEGMFAHKGNCDNPIHKK